MGAEDAWVALSGEIGCIADGSGGRSFVGTGVEALWAKSV